MAEKKNELTFSESLNTALVEVKDALPKELNVTRFVNNAIALLNENKQLQDFASKVPNGKAQIRANMVKAAYLGLDFMNKEAYLVPFKDTLNFMKSYTGAIKLCKKYSIRPIKEIYAKLVREGDEYETAIIDNEPHITFKPKAFNDGPIKGAFAVVQFEDGGINYTEMSLAELEKRRSCSMQKDGPTWKKWTDQMYLKTVLHSLCKTIQIDFDNAEQVKYFNEEMQIVTDPQEQAKSDIENNANSVEFGEQETFTVDENGEVIE